MNQLLLGLRIWSGWPHGPLDNDRFLPRAHGCSTSLRGLWQCVFQVTGAQLGLSRNAEAHIGWFLLAS